MVLLNYFGEKISESECGACDNCLSPRATYDGTLAAQKFLSCVFRVRQHSGFAFGLNQVVDVLVGADTENIRKWGHEKVSTYGIGTEHKRGEWQAIGRELVRLGYLKQSAAKFSTLDLTASGMEALKQRTKITLTKPIIVPEREKLLRTGQIICDEALFERLRVLRRRLAEERAVPPYVIFSDVTLRQIAREYPTSEREFSKISGVGEKKLADLGPAFLGEVAAYLGSNARQIFADDSFVEQRARDGSR